MKRIAFMLALLAATPAVARPLRVVVTEFEGPEPVADTARRLVLDVVDDEHEVHPWKRFLATARRLDIGDYSPRTVAAVARQARVDAVVEGEISESASRRRLTLSVREARTGRVVDTLEVVLHGDEIGEEAREAIAGELLELLDSTEPLEEESLAAAIGPAPWAEPAAPAAPVPAPKPAAKAAPPAFVVTGGVGVAATRRHLTFYHDPLPVDEQPQGMVGNPGAGVAVNASALVAPIGVTLVGSYERSVGARLGYRDGSVIKQLSVSQRQMALGLRAGTRIRRVGIFAGVGYRELAYTIANKPGTLLIPDARYSFVDVGGGLRVAFRDDRVALSAEGGYLHCVSATGITDAMAYGKAGVEGLRADLAIEVKVSESTLLRLGGGYTRVVLVFAGEGRLAHSLDGDEARDVGGARDDYLGGYLLFGFLL